METPARTFAEWLTQELKRRDLSVSAFSRQSGIPRNTIYQWLTSDLQVRQVPSSDNCQRIARGLDLDEDYVLLLAGRRSQPDNPEDAELFAAIKEAEGILRHASRDVRRFVLDTARVAAEQGEVLLGQRDNPVPRVDNALHPQADNAPRGSTTNAPEGGDDSIMTRHPTTRRLAYVA